MKRKTGPLHWSEPVVRLLRPRLPLRPQAGPVDVAHIAVPDADHWVSCRVVVAAHTGANAEDIRFGPEAVKQGIGRYTLGSMQEPAFDPSAPFGQLLGGLIALLRAPHAEDRVVASLLESMTARVTDGPVLIEAGIENSWALDGDPLKARLQSRQVDAIRVAPGATTMELLAMARALADDEAPIPSTANVRVKLLPDPLPLHVSGQRMAIGDPSGTGVPRARTGDQLTAMVEGILQELEKAINRQQWHAVLHDAQAALRALPAVQEDNRRTYGIALRRMLSRPVLETLIEQAYRVSEERGRTAEVLRAGGLAAAELMLEALKQSDTIGPRAFLVDSLAGMPEALPLILPLLKSPRAGEVRLGAELLGRLGVPQAVPALLGQVNHPDERVRLAVIEAMGHYREKAVVEPLRQALGHDTPSIRAEAGRALAARGSAAIAMPLLAALEAERDATVWGQLLESIAGIDAPEAASALTGLALEKPGLLGRRSALERKQLAVVQALAVAGTAAARQALARIAAEGKGAVREAAERATAEGGGA